mgnify:CR=1 FL=1
MAPEAYDVARLELAHAVDAGVRASGPAVRCHIADLHADALEAVVHEPGAVESVGALPAADVRLAEVAVRYRYERRDLVSVRDPGRR